MSIRLLCFALLELESSLHLGSGEGDNRFADQPLLRDLCDVPYIPGNTLAGALAKRLGAAWEKWLHPKNNEGSMTSPLVVEDAYPLPAQEKSLRWPVEVRNHETQMRNTQTAKTDHHFQSEMLPRGVLCRFTCRADFETDAKRDEFLKALESFLAGGGSLGGKQNAGSGDWKTQDNRLAYVSLDLSQPDDVKAWLLHWHGFYWQGDWATLQQQRNVTIRKISGMPSGNGWVMRLPVEIRGLHLSAGDKGMPRKNEADLTQAQRWVMDDQGNLAPEYVDFGSTLKGRVRTAMEMLLRTYLRFGSLPTEKVEELLPFNPTLSPGDRGTDGLWREAWDFFGHRNKKGGFRVKESFWEGDPASSTGEDHIQLCEFTQQVITGAKFMFAPLRQGRMTVEVRLPDGAQEWQKAILYYTGVLLSKNILPWGGHASRGYLGARFTGIEVSEKPTQETKQALRAKVSELLDPYKGKDNDETS